MSARKKNSLNRQVRRAYRQNELARICTMPEREFSRAFGMKTVTVAQRAPHNYYHFRDNGASVLAVAHLDTVVKPSLRAPRFTVTQTGPLIVSGALDDRLGAYVILDLLPKLGVTCDWLLTVGEENGMSTAEFFDPPKEYDWVIEFDRGGTDVVMYQYEDEASRQAVQASGATVGHGSFSDIASLEHLSVKAFNWGVGYRGNYHSERGYAFLYDTFAMVARYLRFHAQNAGKAMPHEPHWKDVYYGGSLIEERSYSERAYQEIEDFIDCASCGALQAVDPYTLICAYCDTCLNCTEESVACTCPGGPGVWTATQIGKPVSLPADYDNESDDESDYGNECRHVNYTTCGCANGLQEAARETVTQTTAN
jgi:hypothetical protein